MAQINYEQENNGLEVLDQLNERHVFNKTQITEMNRKTQKVFNTPMTKGLSSLKTPSMKSSRKAFGNVSNVLRSGTSSSHQSIASKPPLKALSLKETENSVKECKPQTKQSNETQMTITCDHKYFDDIEDMHPMLEELVSDSNDPITHDLFAIEDQTLFSMPFDSDLDQCLFGRPKNSDINDFL